MSARPDPDINFMEGAEALPRRNGELVFQEPWEGRAFGIGVALNNQRVYEWREFREHLVHSIATDEATDIPSGYYDRWLTAMEALLLEQGLITPEELDQRTEEFATGQRGDPADQDDDDHGHH